MCTAQAQQSINNSYITRARYTVTWVAGEGDYSDATASNVRCSTQTLARVPTVGQEHAHIFAWMELSCTNGITG